MVVQCSAACWVKSQWNRKLISTSAATAVHRDKQSIQVVCQYLESILIGQKSYKLKIKMLELVMYFQQHIQTLTAPTVALQIKSYDKALSIHNAVNKNSTIFIGHSFFIYTNQIWKYIMQKYNLENQFPCENSVFKCYCGFYIFCALIGYCVKICYNYSLGFQVWKLFQSGLTSDES